MKLLLFAYVAMAQLSQYVAMIADNPMALLPLVIYFVRKH